MKKLKETIVSSISKKTGSSEEVTEKIITEFIKVLKKASVQSKEQVFPGLRNISATHTKPIKSLKPSRNITKAKRSYSVDNATTNIQNTLTAEEQVLRYFTSTRRHIIDQLHSKKKSREILERFIKMSSIPNKFLAEKVFEISPKTLYTYKSSNKILPVRIKEQILKLEELFKKGVELFGSKDHFNKWLKSESYGLGGTKPIDMINSITGIDLVYEELIRIEFGATA